MNSKILLAASLIAVFTIGLSAQSSLAFAQYMGNVGSEGQTGSYTLEEALEIQSRRVASAEANPAAGSGTPYISADGVVGAAEYKKYAIELICKEGVETALERSINTMVNWAKEKDSAYNHYFLYASTNRITWDIKDGKISPWLVLNCASGKAALNNFNDEQLSMLGAVLDPSHWALRFKRQPKDVELVKQVAREANL